LTTVAIHQPEYFPWLGFFDKVRRADLFVLLDNVQFDRASTQQRTKVAGSGGPVWMSIPFVHRFPQRIDEVELADGKWSGKHLKTLQACYGRTAGFRAQADELRAFFARQTTRLVDVTVPSIELLLKAFAIDTPVVRASTLDVTGHKGDLVLALCKQVGATVYLSGRTGATYLDRESFAREGVEVIVQSYTVPSYPRMVSLPPEEVGSLSAVDAWLHLGPEAPALFAS
jgi:hypothetical protein